MKTFFALAVGTCCIMAAPSYAEPGIVPLGHQADSLRQNAVYGDAPMPGRHRGGRRGRGPVAKSVSPTLPSTKGVSQEDADKQYRKKYGF